MQSLALTVFVAVLGLATTAIHAAGFRLIEVPADTGGPALKGGMWYPCSAPSGEIHLGNVVLRGVKDCPISGEKLALVIFSHGRGGSFIGHHDTAETLADAGFVVVAVNHPGSTSLDNRVGDLSALVERPTDIKRLIDFMLLTSPASSIIDPLRIGFFGFSMGGYTGLVVIGANPDWAIPLCRQSSAVPVCEQILRKEFRVQPLVHDPRIKAAVIANPFSAFFAADSFAAVKVPVQLWASTRSGDEVTPEDVAMVDRNLPVRHEYHVVPNSGHFAFLAPCAPAFAKARPELCSDAPGFDRVAFHSKFNVDVLAFFRAHLAER